MSEFHQKEARIFMDYNAQTLLAQATQQLRNIFNVFSSQKSIELSYFKKGEGAIVSDCLNFYLFMQSRSKDSQEFDIMQLYRDVTQEIHQKNPYKLLFLAEIASFYSQAAFSLKIPDFKSFLTEYSDLIPDVYLNKNYDILEFSAKSLSDLITKDVTLIEDVYKWMQSKEIEESFIEFLLCFRWPKTLTNDCVDKIVAAIIDINARNKQEEKSQIILSSIRQILSLDGSQDSNANALLENAELSKETKFIFECTLKLIVPSQILQLQDKIDDLLDLIPNSDYISTIITLLIYYSQRSKESTETETATKRFALNLSSILISCSAVEEISHSTLDIIYDFISLIYQDDQVIVKSQLINFISDENSNEMIVGECFKFIINHNIPLVDFIPTEKQTESMPLLVRHVNKSAMKNLHDPNLIYLLEFLKVFNNYVFEKYEPPEETDNTLSDLSSFILEGDSFLGIGDIPWHKIERLVFLCFFNADPKIRKSAYELLSINCDAFKKVNDDWEEYELEARPFLIQFTNDISFFIKKNISPIISPEQLLEKDQERINGLCYLCRRMTTSRSSFACKIIRDALKHADKTPILMNIVVSSYVPCIVRKFETDDIQFEDIIEKCIELNQPQSLSNLNLEYFKSCFEIVLKSDASCSLLAEVFTAISQSGLTNVLTLTNEHFENEINSFLELYKENKSVKERAAEFVQFAINMAAQFQESTKIKELSQSIIEFTSIFYELFKKNKSVYNLNMFRANFEWSLAFLKVKNNSLIDSIAEDHMSFPHSHVLIPLYERLQRLYPDSLSKYLLKIFNKAPDAVSYILLKEKGLNTPQNFVLFCYFVSDKKNSIIFSLFKDYVKQALPEFANKINTLKAEEIITFFAINYTECTKDIINYCTNYYNAKSGSLDLQLRIFEVLHAFSGVSPTSFSEVVKLGYKLSKSHIFGTEWMLKFWEPLLSPKSSALAVFEVLPKLGCDYNILKYIYDLCQYKEDVDELAIKMALETSEIVSLLSGNKSSNLLSLYYLACFPMKWTKASILLTLLLVQIENSIHNYEAIKFIKKMIGDDIPLIGLDLLIKIVMNLPTDEATDFGIHCLDIFKECTKPLPFKYIDMVLAAISYAFPNVTAKFIDSTGENLSVLLFRSIVSLFQKNDNDANLISLMSELFCNLRDITELKRLPGSIVLTHIKFGLKLIDIDSDSINTAFIRFLIAAAEAGYLENAPQRLLEEIIKLIYHGNTYWTKFESSLIPLIDTSKLKDPEALFWLGVVAGKSVLNKNAMESEIFKSLEKATVFGGSIVVQKMGQLIQNYKSPKISEDRHLLEFIQFLVLSTEVDPSNAMTLIQIAEECMGPVDWEYTIMPNTADIHIPKYRKTPNEIREIYYNISI